MVSTFFATAVFVSSSHRFIPCAVAVRIEGHTLAGQVIGLSSQKIVRENIAPFDLGVSIGTTASSLKVEIFGDHIVLASRRSVFILAENQEGWSVSKRISGLFGPRFGWSGPTEFTIEARVSKADVAVSAGVEVRMIPRSTVTKFSQFCLPDQVHGAQRIDRFLSSGSLSLLGVQKDVTQRIPASQVFDPGVGNSGYSLMLLSQFVSKDGRIAVALTKGDKIQSLNVLTSQGSIKTQIRDSKASIGYVGSGVIVVELGSSISIYDSATLRMLGQA